MLIERVKLSIAEKSELDSVLKRGSREDSLLRLYVLAKRKRPLFYQVVVDSTNEIDALFNLKPKRNWQIILISCLFIGASNDEFF